MAVAQVILLGLTMGDGYDFFPSGNWDGYVCPVTSQFAQGLFQGYFLDWGGFNQIATLSPFFNQPYVGYNTNWGAVEGTGLDGNFRNSLYVGYNTNWGSNIASPTEKTLEDIDLDSVVDFPKDQYVYYKLKGWNPNTLSYESWVIKEIITGRPEIFDPDPGRQPPNVERDVFKTPPSGNSLVNIAIVGRWIE